MESMQLFTLLKVCNEAINNSKHFLLKTNRSYCIAILLNSKKGLVHSKHSKQWLYTTKVRIYLMIYEKVPQVYFSLDPKHFLSLASLQKSEILISPHSFVASV